MVLDACGRASKVSKGARLNGGAHDRFAFRVCAVKCRCG
jgi:hypothetical protein